MGLQLYLYAALILLPANLSIFAIIGHVGSDSLALAEFRTAQQFPDMSEGNSYSVVCGMPIFIALAVVYVHAVVTLLVDQKALKFLTQQPQAKCGHGCSST